MLCHGANKMLVLGRPGQEALGADPGLSTPNHNAVVAADTACTCCACCAGLQAEDRPAAQPAPEVEAVLERHQHADVFPVELLQR